jgi:hypothetical protein
MKANVHVVIESDEGTTEAIENIIHLERGDLHPEGLGLTLAEARTLLQNMQRAMVEQQVVQYLEQQGWCLKCEKKRNRKGAHDIVYRTLFGKLRLRSIRLFHCGCQSVQTKSFSPLAQLLSERTAPKLLYLESKFASLISYGLTVDLLQEVLPIGQEINAATVRNNMHHVSQRIEDELGEERVVFIDGCERDWGQLPRPDLP